MHILKVLAQSLSVAAIVVSCGALLLLGKSAFGYQALIIPTGSMRPNIPIGSLILTHRVSTQSLKVGDVITYISPINPNMTISHRIVQKTLYEGKVPEFVTKGDANKFSDIPVLGGSVEGKVVWHIPDVGGWLLYLKEPIVILPIVYLVGLLVSIDELARLAAYYKKIQPYRLPGFEHGYVRKNQAALKSKVGLAVVAVALLITVGLIVDPRALALQQSNPVTLTNISLTTALSTSQANN